MGDVRHRDLGKSNSKSDDETPDESATPEPYVPTVPVLREKKVLFHYPHLPTWEFALYVSGVLFIIYYCWYLIYGMSSELHDKRGIWHGFRTYGRMVRVEHPVFGPRLYDGSNWEWRNYKQLVPYIVVFTLLHSIMFNAIDYIVSADKPFTQQILRTVLAVPITIACYGWYPVVTCVPQGIFIFTITRITKSQVAMWISILPVMYTIMHSDFLDAGDEFVPMLLGSYKCLMYISYCLEWLRGNVAQDNKDSYWKAVLRMFHYAFYMPYGASVIVTYAQFEQQLIERKTATRDWKSLIFYAARLAFWYIVLDTVLHFFYFEMLLRSEMTMRKIRLDQLTTLGAAMGQFFHLKYVIIFGIPRLFAKIDKMTPPAAPICTSRVVLYSNIWRGFDVGLYVFFKEYIFLPICRPTFSLWRKIIGVLMAYGFVLHWHGYTRANVIWIVFNILEMFLEAITKTIYGIPAVRAWRERHISDLMFRRIIAFFMVCPYAISLYSNFYFLGGGAAGWVFVDRVFWGETVTFHYPFPLLVGCGYVFTSVIMTLDQYFYDKQHLASKQVDDGQQVERNKKVK